MVYERARSRGEAKKIHLKSRYCLCSSALTALMKGLTMKFKKNKSQKMTSRGLKRQFPETVRQANGWKSIKQ